MLTPSPDPRFRFMVDKYVHHNIFVTNSSRISKEIKWRNDRSLTLFLGPFHPFGEEQEKFMLGLRDLDYLANLRFGLFYKDNLCDMNGYSSLREAEAAYFKFINPTPNESAYLPTNLTNSLNPQFSALVEEYIYRKVQPVKTLQHIVAPKYTLYFYKRPFLSSVAIRGLVRLLPEDKKFLQDLQYFILVYFEGTRKFVGIPYYSKEQAETDFSNWASKPPEL